MRAKDIMTLDVATVGPAAPLKEALAKMLDRNVSAIPVVDDEGRPVGIVSEGDLIRRQEIGTEKHPSWWLQAFHSRENLADDFAKSHGTRVADVMTRDVVTVGEDTPLAAVATELERNRIKRVPVVRDHKMVGLVSRSDLVRALAVRGGDFRPEQDIQVDAELGNRVRQAIETESSADVVFVNVIVSDGKVHLFGAANSDAERRAIRVAAEEVAGPENVVDNLGLLSPAVRQGLWAY